MLLGWPCADKLHKTGQTLYTSIYGGGQGVGLPRADILQQMMPLRQELGLLCFQLTIQYCWNCCLMSRCTRQLLTFCHLSVHQFEEPVRPRRKGLMNQNPPSDTISPLKMCRAASLAQHSTKPDTDMRLKYSACILGRTRVEPHTVEQE